MASILSQLSSLLFAVIMSCTHPPRIVQISLNQFPPPGLIYTEPRREDDMYYGSVLKVSDTDYVPVLIQERALPGFACPCGKPLTAPAAAALPPLAPVPQPVSRPDAAAALPPLASVPCSAPPPLAQPSLLESLGERDHHAFFLSEEPSGDYADDGSGSEVEDADGCVADSFHFVSACGRLYDLDPSHDFSEQHELIKLYSTAASASPILTGVGMK